MTRTKQPRRIVTEVTNLNGRAMRVGGVNEIATELNVNASRVTTWRHRARKNAHGQTPPEPVLVRSMGPMFNLDEWRRWYGLEPLTGGEIVTLIESQSDDKNA